MKKINGKHYPLWSQFVEREDEFIGKPMHDSGVETEIVGIELTPNGEDSAFFTIKGKDFDCGFDVGFGGMIAGLDGWITFSRTYQNPFRIKA